MAGIPPEVIDRAREILASLEASELQIAEAHIQRAIPFPQRTTREEREAKLKQAFASESAGTIAGEIRGLDLNALTPIEAMNRIAEWKKNLDCADDRLSASD